MTTEDNFISKKYCDDLFNSKAESTTNFYLDYNLNSQTNSVGTTADIILLWRWNPNLLKIELLVGNNIARTWISDADLQKNTVTYTTPLNYDVKTNIYKARATNKDNSFYETNDFDVEWIITGGTSTGFDNTKPLELTYTGDQDTLTVQGKTRLKDITIVENDLVGNSWTINPDGTSTGLGIGEGYTKTEIDSQQTIQDDNIISNSDRITTLENNPFGEDWSQPKHITNTNSSNNSSSGALIVDGGVGIKGDINTPKNITCNGFVSNTMTVGYGDVYDNTCQFVSGTDGFKIQSHNESWSSVKNLNLNPDGGDVIIGSGGTSLGGILSGTSWQINADGTSTGLGIGEGGGFDPSQPLHITNTTESTNTSTGAIICDGGVGIAKNLNVGGDLTVTSGQSKFLGSPINQIGSTNSYFPYYNATSGLYEENWLAGNTIAAGDLEAKGKLVINGGGGVVDPIYGDGKTTFNFSQTGTYGEPGNIIAGYTQLNGDLGLTGQLIIKSPNQSTSTLRIYNDFELDGNGTPEERWIFTDDKNIPLFIRTPKCIFENTPQIRGDLSMDNPDSDSTVIHLGNTDITYRNDLKKLTIYSPSDSVYIDPPVEINGTLTCGTIRTLYVNYGAGWNDLYIGRNDHLVDVNIQGTLTVSGTINGASAFDVGTKTIDEDFVEKLENIPPKPSVAGNYLLNCSVDIDNNATYSWLSV